MMRASSSSSTCLAAVPRKPSRPAAVSPHSEAGYTTASAEFTVIVRKPLQEGGGPYTVILLASSVLKSLKRQHRLAQGSTIHIEAGAAFQGSPPRATKLWPNSAFPTRFVAVRY